MEQIHPSIVRNFRDIELIRKWCMEMQNFITDGTKVHERLVRSEKRRASMYDVRHLSNVLSRNV